MDSYNIKMDPDEAYSYPTSKVEHAVKEELTHVVSSVKSEDQVTWYCNNTESYENVKENHIFQPYTKQEPCFQLFKGIHERGQDAFVANNKMVKINNEDLLITNIKKEPVTENIVEQKCKNEKYDIDIIEHKVDCKDDNDCSLFGSEADAQSSNSSNGKGRVSGVNKISSSVFEDQQNMKYYKDSYYKKLNFESKAKKNTLQFNINTAGKREKYYECNECCRIFSHRIGITVHIAKAHSQIQTSIGIHECNECYKTFLHKYGVQRHISLVHERIRKYECIECNKWFITKGNLKSHITVVHERKCYECKECHKNFSQISNLQAHINVIHRRIRNYECNVCCKLFSCKSHLKKHITTMHNATKEFECNECHKLFSTRYHLQIHIEATHKGIKYECKKCHKKLSFRSSLQRHINICK